MNAKLQVPALLLAMALGGSCTQSGSELSETEKTPGAAPAGQVEERPEGSGARNAGTEPLTGTGKAGKGPSVAGTVADTSAKGGKIMLSDEEWKKKLTPEQYYICRQKGTERAFTGKYWNSKKEGTYVCVACGNELFSSDTKFDSGTGWPSYWAPIEKESVSTETDRSLFMTRTEVLCSRCDSHLGHVFDDGPAPTNLRYCINSAALDFKEREGEKADP